MMSKKDYAAIATIVGKHVASKGAREVAIDLAAYFEQDDPRFNSTQFLDAAGVLVLGGRVMEVG
jgi:hypothetical protein